MRPSDELRVYLLAAAEGDTLEISIPAARELLAEIDDMKRQLAKTRKETPWHP